MAPLSLKVVQDEGAVTRTVKFESKSKVSTALATVKEKILTGDDGKEYGLFLTSADDDLSGIWLEDHRNLEYYMLRDGDTLHYLCKRRNLKVRMLDGSVKTLLIDESKPVEQLMMHICARIGITNHDEYGLCPDDDVEEEEKPMPATGTLTLRRVKQEKEKDVMLEQLSKKLKTDDNVQWLDKHKTLREQGVGARQRLLLKRRLFYSDRNVDARDPVQLNLLYLQARDAILNGKHPVTEDKAVVFAGIQCQICYGDFHEEKHRAGLIENLKEFLPEQYASSWGIEKKILKEHRKHQGVSSIDAKYLYTKTARDLPTYGVTFFLVKEKHKGKKKLIPRLLGINAEAILRLDEVTKEILQVWPLTHVKSYQVGTSKTFSLNFGEYSDKEYCVKTNDAIRIRDILQGYIDIIGKRLAGVYNNTLQEHAAISEENIIVSKGNIIQHVGQGPSKIVEETFIGPSKLINFQPGSVASHGTQLVTVQQMMVTNLSSNPQQPISGEVPMRKDMSLDSVRRLNRLNSSSVKIVSYLADPNDSNISETRKILETVKAEMPAIVKGVKETAEKQTSEEEKKKLLDQVQELCNAVDALSAAMESNSIDADKAQDAAKDIANLSAQLYSCLDPKTQRRSKLLEKSRSSFIADERTTAYLHRASFLATASKASQAVDQAKDIINTEYQGPKIDQYGSELYEFEKAAAQKMGKLNAAVAFVLMAQADPKNVDYSSAVVSMNTINELVPELAKDAQALASCMEGDQKKAFLDDIAKLFDATSQVCSLTSIADHEKVQEISNVYSDRARKLVFTFTRGTNDDQDNKITDLAKDVGDKTSLLLMQVNKLAESKSEQAFAVDEAGVRCADAARDLLFCAMLTSPTIHEPHCQSALTAAAETLSSSAQHLMANAKPLLEQPTYQHLTDELHAGNTDLNKALDRLKQAYASENGSESDKVLRQQQRLKFMTTAGNANKYLGNADKELSKPLVTDHKGISLATEDDVAKRIAKLKAIIAAVVLATTDRDKPDYASAELAVGTMYTLLPSVIRDVKALTANKDAETRDKIMKDLKNLLDAAREICASASSDNEDLNGAGAKFAEASNDLYNVFNPQVSPVIEDQIMDDAAAACTLTSEMLANVYQLAEEIGGEPGSMLDSKGAATADAAKALLTIAQLTASCVNESRCQPALVSAADKLSDVARDLEAGIEQVAQDQRYAAIGSKIKNQHQLLQDALEKLKRSCQPAVNKGQRLQYVRTAREMKNALQAAQQELEKPVVLPVKGEAAVIRQLQLTQRMAQLNSAIAALVAASSDAKNVDYTAAEQAISTINELLPQVVKETRALSAGSDEKSQAAQAELLALCDAVRGISDAVEQQDLKGINQYASKFSNSSNKLIFVVNPRTNLETSNQIVELSSSACEQASQLVAEARKLSKTVGGQVHLEDCCERTANAANALLTCAKLTASCMSEPCSKSALVSVVESLSNEARNLLTECTPLAQKPGHGTGLEQQHQRLQSDLDVLKHTCLDGKSGHKALPKSLATGKEKHRLQFITTSAAIKDAVKTAHQEIDKPVEGPVNKDEALARQQQLSQQTALLNAATAALLAAISDPDQPNYVTADQAVHTINQLLPRVVKESRVLSAAADERSQASTRAQLRALSDATRDLCRAAGEQDLQKLNANASKFASASNKLNPRPKSQKVIQIMNLSQSIHDKTGKMVIDVHNVAKTAGGEVGTKLSRSGEKTTNAATVLLTTTQLTAPCITEPECQSTLISAADGLSVAVQELTRHSNPLKQTRQFADFGVKLDVQSKELQRDLKEFQSACRNIETDKITVLESPKTEKQHLEFVKTVSASKNAIDAAQQELNKPIGAPVKSEIAAIRQLQLTQNLAKLNAAIAALLAATSDRNHPDYIAAEQAISTINELLPHVVKETRALNTASDEQSQANTQAELRSLCEIARELCNAAGERDAQKLNEHASKFANSSSRLLYVVNPRTKPETANKIMNLSKSAYNKAAQMVTDVQQTARTVGGEVGTRMKNYSDKTADVARVLLTSAKLTAPCIKEPHCQSTLVSAIDSLSAAVQELTAQCDPLKQRSQYSAFGSKLESQSQDLQKDLQELKGVCQNVTRGPGRDDATTEDANRQEQRLQFVKVVSNSKNVVDAALQELNKPVVGPPLKGEAATAQQLKLSQRMAQLNAAIAALVTATSGRDKIDYVTAERAVSHINELLPRIVKESKVLSARLDDASQAILIGEMRGLCSSTQDLCDAAGQQNIGAINDRAAKCANTMGKLYSVVNPHIKPDKEQVIINLSTKACSGVSQILATVYQLAENESGHVGSQLDQAGARTADAAKTLLTASQLTAPYIHESPCQLALISAVNGLSTSSQQLADTWQPVVKNPRHAATRKTLEEQYPQFERDLESLKKACQNPSTIVNQSSKKKQPPPPPKPSMSKHKQNIVAHPVRESSRDINQEFLDQIRCEETDENTQSTVKSPKDKNGEAVIKIDEEKKVHKQFVSSVEDALRNLRIVEEDIKKLYTLKASNPTLDKDQAAALQKSIEQKLGHSAATVAALLASNKPGALDCVAATKSMKTFSALMPAIAKDAKTLHSSVAEKDRKAFLDNLLAYFECSNKLCNTVTADRKKLNEVGVEYGNTSAKLLYSVGTDVDPEQEKEVITRARAIGDSMSRAVRVGARVAAAPARAAAVCAAAGRAADAAGALAYTAKLVAASIQIPECQRSLMGAIDELGSNLKTFSATWKPLAEDPQYTEIVQDMGIEQNNLEKLLQELKQDLESGKLVKIKEKIVVEDTPLRQLAMSLLQNAEKRSKSANIDAKQKREYEEYANTLRDAVAQLDSANWECRRSLHDTDKCIQLENAVQNLQVSVLQGRPSQAGKPQNNIVDLTDFVKELSNEADEMIAAANKCSSNVQIIKDINYQIKTDAYNITNPSNDHNRGTDTTVDDIQEINRFGRDCTKYIQEIKSEISKVADIKEKTMLEDKILSLEDTLNLLRFAAQSAVATTASASLDETLCDLTELENRIQQMLLPADKLTGLNTKRSGPGSGFDWGKSQVVAAASGANLHKLAPAFLAYADDMRTQTKLSDPGENKRLKEHLQKMIQLLKTLTVTTSRRVATWQDISGPEVASVTEQLLKEIDAASEGAPGKTRQSVMSNVDANKLLLFTEKKIEGDRKKIEDKLQQTSTKLNSMLGTVVMSTHNSQSLTRSLKATVEAATELAALARALKTNDPVQNSKIEEAVREMNFQTYNVVKLLDLVSQDPNNRVYRKRLLDACRLLNDAINKLGRVTSNDNKRRRECNEFSRSLQLQQGLLQGAPQPTCSMSYSDCIDALQSQSEIIDKLKNEDPMSREELSKTLGYVSSAVHNSTEFAVQCAYYLSLSDRDIEVAKTGLVDVNQLMSTVEALHEICYRILQFEPDQAKSEEPNLNKQVQNLKQTLIEGSDKSVHMKEELVQVANKVDKAVADLHNVIHEPNSNRAKITSATMKVLDTLKLVNSISEHPSLIPKENDVSTEAQQRRDDVMKNSRSLTTKTLSLIREVGAAEDRETMTWVMFNTRKELLQIFETLLESVKDNGKRAGILEASELEENTKKSYVQIQLELASKWLQAPTCKPDTKRTGEAAAQKILDIAEKMAEELKGPEKEEICHLTEESKQLLTACAGKHTMDKAGLLLERLKGLRKCIERGIVTMVVEDFMEGEEPLADLEYIIDIETDEAKRKFLLERKIAELLAQLGRVKKTARLVADAGSGGQHISVELETCTNQADLLAPMLVKAAQERVGSPNDEAVVDNYKAILAKFAENMSRVRELCDQSVDPMDFVQTAGETMQRMREDSSLEKDNYQYALSITKLANRVINVGMKSCDARHDPELQRALAAVRRRVAASVPARRSLAPDWRLTTAEILRTTGEVESVLGGEMIFQKQPESNQPIFTAALGLHTAVREWSARDNEIVAVAKRMAVLMARLSDYMNNNRKRELIATSKKIVSESAEVAELARKLAHECSDMRIKNNLLQVCQRIPTISGQLKMLTTVKGSMLGPEGSREDQEDVNMLVNNAENLMLSIQEVVKVSAGASVKIMSQRGGPRVRWVRKNYY